MRAAEFFAYSRERHATYLRRSAGLPRSRWTQDPILQRYRFCNVFRELDRTTIWFRDHVREGLRDKPEVLLATVLFRWFNRTTTGEAIFCQPALGLGGELSGETAWDAFLRTGDVGPLRAAILSYCDRGPYVTGSYIIKTPDDHNKLDGVLWCVEQFAARTAHDWTPDKKGWREFAEVCLTDDTCGAHVPLEHMWSWLRQFPYMGDFMAYEVVTDLRHTALLDKAPDIMTWANPGPGARRGLNRLCDRPLEARVPREQLIAEMRELLKMSGLPCHWPQLTTDGKWLVDGYGIPDQKWTRDDWPLWEMRDVEHTLCELDKYERARLGQGKPRGVFR